MPGGVEYYLLFSIPILATLSIVRLQLPSWKTFYSRSSMLIIVHHCTELVNRHNWLLDRGPVGRSTLINLCFRFTSDSLLSTLKLIWSSWWCINCYSLRATLPAARFTWAVPIGHHPNWALEHFLPTVYNQSQRDIGEPMSLARYNLNYCVGPSQPFIIGSENTLPACRNGNSWFLACFLFVC